MPAPIAIVLPNFDADPIGRVRGGSRRTRLMEQTVIGLGSFELVVILIVLLLVVGALFALRALLRR